MRYQNVIVGGGLAGGMVAQEYREQGGDGSVLIVAKENHVPYHRPPLTKEYLRGEKPEEEVYMHPAEWWQNHEVEVVGDLTGKGVWTLSPGDGGVHIRFDWRVIADRPLLRMLTPVLRPVFRWNHNWSIKRAIEGLEPYARSRPSPSE